MVLNDLERLFFWGSVGAMVTILATGAGRTVSTKMLSETATCLPSTRYSAVTSWGPSPATRVRVLDAVYGYQAPHAPSPSRRRTSQPADSQGCAISTGAATEAMTALPLLFRCRASDR